MSLLVYDGANFLRQRLVLATISGRAVQIRNIRAESEYPGLQDYEASFIRLLDKLTDGSRITINETGTQLKYVPGQIIGGNVVHECPPTRSVTYFLEAVLMLAPLSKQRISLILKGVTNDQIDISVDTFKAVTLSVVKKCGLQDAECTINKRGVSPGGGGEVHFACSPIKTLPPINLLDEGKTKRVRGVVFTANVTPQFGGRIVEAARGVLNDYLPDVWIFTDTKKNDASGASPGYGVSLVAETMKGNLKSADEMSASCGVEPELLGKRCALRLLEEVDLDSVVDSAHQILALHFMGIADDVSPSRIRLAKLTPATVQFLRHQSEFLGLRFQFKNDEESVLCSCIGLNLTNIARRTF